jgi:mannose-6-phosphate isomerase-like protein (cupin superfamily)
MKRRSFLKATAALLPAAGLESFALAQSLTVPQSDQVHIVGAGLDRFGEPHSYGFSEILFKFGSQEANGGLFIIEHINMTKGGPHLHLHFSQDEWFYVMEGEVLFQIGDGRKRLQAGESVLAPRNIPHTFTPIGDKPGHMLIAFTPAGKMEQYFRDTAIPNPPHQDAEFYGRYGMELIGPPLTV